jgi:putative ABC transport system permease protein
MSEPRWFRRLLRLLPFDFRADYGREMEQVFREQQRDASGRLARTGVWLHAIADLAAIGPREHLTQLRQDLEYALRGMRRNPGFVAVAVITLALGIGTNTAMFSVVHAVLLRPLPYADPDRLVALYNRIDGNPELALSDPEYLDYSERTRTLTLAVVATDSVNLTGDALESERVLGASVTANMFDVVGVQPAVGRAFRPEESVPGAPPVVILTDRLWRRRYAADPAMVGRTITLNGDRQQVVGIMPAQFALPPEFGSDQPVSVLLPQEVDPSAPRSRRGGHYLAAVARLKPGVSIEAASADMAGVIAGLKREYPEQHTQPNWGILLRPLRTDLLGPSRPIVLTLLAAVGLVLLMTCANVANLLLARGEVRRRELSVRAALGASRFRLVRQLLTESCALALAGAALGLLVAAACQRLVLMVDPTTLPRVADMQLSVPVLAFTIVLAVGTGLVFGLIPAVQISRDGVHDALTAGGRGTTGGMRGRLRGALVVAQVAVAVALLFAAGLVVRSFVNLVRVPSGIRADRVLTMRVSLPSVRYPAQQDVGVFFNALLDRVRAVPGAQLAGAATGLPLSVASGDWSFDVDGRAIEGRRHFGAADWYAVTPGYFETLGIRLVSGRLPQASDDANAGAPVILLNQTAARSLFPAGDALGQRLKVSGAESQPWRTVAGIVGDVRHRGLDRPARPEMFFPLAQFRHFSPGSQARALTVVVRTAIDPMALAPALRAALREQDPEVPAAQLRDMASVVSASVADRRLTMLLMGGFGALALLVAAVGVYGVMAYHVVQRTREMGVRLALGASPDDVLALVVGQGMRLVAVGLAIGVAGAVAVSGALTQMLFAVEPRDTATMVAAPVVLGAVALAACLVPARRATRVDPAIALRIEQ